MSIGQRVRDYLDSHHVNYTALPHTQAYPTRNIAEELDASGKHFAKSIILRADDHLLMAVLPASHRLNLHKLKVSLEAKRLEVVSESELNDLRSDSELGAFPPFGNFYGMETWVDRSLGKSEEIVFNAGTHRDAVRMRYADYLRLAMPQVATFSTPARPRQAA
ncbi:MAG: YbaK/EbsC family protein [Acidobacteria bacterium]|nr:YbaK/EbsC family protein [Acidobacteriota bacterium]